MLKGLKTYGLVSAIVLIALATLLISPPTRVVKTGPSPAAATPKKVSSPVSQLPGPPERANREARESAYAKLGLDGKLIIKQPAPEIPAPEEPPTVPEPAPAPQTERDPERKPKNRTRAGVTDAPVLPETMREAPAQEKSPVQAAPTPRTPEVSEEVSPPAPVVLPRPTDTTLRLTVPRLGLSNVTVGDSPEQSYLDR
jgi:hypothetical protein